MFQELHDYEIYPKVFLKGREQKITIKPYGARRFPMEAGVELKIRIVEFEKAENNRFSGTNAEAEFTVVTGDKGVITFNYIFPEESMYFITVYFHEEAKRNPVLRVYALNEDLAGFYPFRGDLHMHTCRSDGQAVPAMVAAEYRRKGYDFTVISDHHRYYPSLEARAAYRTDLADTSDLTDLLIVPGEEVHFKDNAIHYVNFGGEFSVNALIDWEFNKNQEDKGNSLEVRSLKGEAPAVMSEEAYKAMIDRRSQGAPFETESERRTFAAYQWTYEMVQKAKGLGILPHPYWCHTTVDLSESFLRKVYEARPFDAFEVLGGENYYQQNGFQTGFYYEMKAKGIDVPVVGSTDSHNPTENNRNAFLASTIVLAKENTTKSLIEAIKAHRSVAVDTISQEYRLVGDFRLMKYASFLVENWYPIHDIACEGEGFWMKEYTAGNEKAEKVLLDLKGTVPDMMKKYFNIEK